MTQVRALFALLILSLASMGTWVWQTKQKQWAAEQSLRETEVNAAAMLRAKEEEHRNSLNAMIQQHQQDIDAMIERHGKELDGQRQEERKRMAGAMDQFSDILEGNRKTLDYLAVLEQKVKSGQALSANEAQKLSNIATGLNHLQKQYQKPFQEFTELATYFSKRAEAKVDSPNMKNSFWKRLFSRDFREKEREFYRTEGERRGYQEASELFATAYSSAQKQMAAANLNLEKSVKTINQMIDEKRTPEDMDAFFKEARRALSAHQKLLDFEPEAPKPLPTPVRP